MSLLMDELYYAMIGGPHPDRWPEYLAENPVQAHGMHCFRAVSYTHLTLPTTSRG